MLFARSRKEGTSSTRFDFDTTNQEYTDLVREFYKNLDDIRKKFVNLKQKIHEKAVEQKRYTKVEDPKNPDEDIEVPSDFYIQSYLSPESCLHGYRFGTQLGEGVTGAGYRACKEDEKGVCNYNFVAKVSKLPTIRHLAAWKRETKLAKKMGEVGVGPRVIDYWTCEDVFYPDVWDGKSWEATGGSWREDPEIKDVLKTYYKNGNIGVIITEELDQSTSDWMREQGRKLRSGSLSASEYNKMVGDLRKDIEAKMRIMYRESGGYIHKDISRFNNILMRLHPPSTGRKNEVFFIDYGEEGVSQGNEKDLENTIRNVIRDFELFNETNFTNFPSY